MVSRIFIVLISLFISLSNCCLAADGSSESFSTFEAAYQAGVKSYQEKKFDAAKNDFQQALNKEPQSIAALTNLALAQFQNGQKAWAVALLRKATNLNPEFSTSRNALSFILPQLEVKEIPHEILLMETAHSRILAPFPTFIFSIFAALFVFASGWSLLRFFGLRRRSIQSENPPPPFSFLNVLFLLGAIASLTLFGMKLADQRLVRATVVTSDKLGALSLPDEKAPSLFDLYPGLEVIVDQEQKDWYQITYPGGPTGWVPRSAVFITTGS
jgi:tetratricopeptide (TPR) repeat protein